MTSQDQNQNQNQNQDDQTQEQPLDDHTVEPSPADQPDARHDDTADEPSLDARHDDEPRPERRGGGGGRARGGRKPRDPRRRGGEWGAMPGMQHVHDEHDHAHPHDHPEHDDAHHPHDHREDGHTEHDHGEHDHRVHDHREHDHRACDERRAHHGFGPGHHGFGSAEHDRHGQLRGRAAQGDRARGRGRRMDARILRTARTIRRAEHVLGADAVEQTLRESVSHADYVTTVRTLRALAHAARSRAFAARA